MSAGDRATDAAGQAIPFADALQRMAAHGQAVTGSESLPLDQALGRVLALDLRAPRDVPAFANAALDGIAFRWEPALLAGGELALQPGLCAAGQARIRLAAGHAVRILTGAPMPEGADTVVPDEVLRARGDRVAIPGSIPQGANRRMAGEDVAAGSLRLAAGTRLGPWQVGMAAALGEGVLPVHRRVRVALLSTGDELVPAGASWREAAVYDANRPLLTALLAGLPVELHDGGIVPDDPARIRAALAGLAATQDVILASGGASGSQRDHVASLLAREGTLDFWRVAMRPGRPLALGRLGSASCIALPGNPVAAAVAFLRLVRPMLLARAGAGWRLPVATRLPLGRDWPLRPGRTEFLRCRVVRTTQDAWLEPLDRQGSGQLSALLDADGLAELGPGEACARAGEQVPFLSWAALGVATPTID